MNAPPDEVLKEEVQANLAALRAWLERARAGFASLEIVPAGPDKVEHCRMLEETFARLESVLGELTGALAGVTTHGELRQLIDWLATDPRLHLISFDLRALTGLHGRPGETPS